MTPTDMHKGSRNSVAALAVMAFILSPLSVALADDAFAYKGSVSALNVKLHKHIWTRDDEIAVRVRGAQIELSGANNLPDMTLVICSDGQEDAFEFANAECDRNLVIHTEDTQIYGSFNKLLGKLSVVFKNLKRDRATDKMVEDGRFEGTYRCKRYTEG
jgi:hypothetical protein